LGGGILVFSDIFSLKTEFSKIVIKKNIHAIKCVVPKIREKKNKHGKDEKDENDF